MIRPIDIRLNAAHPELPLVEATTFTGAPSSVFIRGVPRSVGNWSITAVNVAVTYPDNSTTARAAVESAEGVWVATIPGTATSGRTAAGFKIMADGIDENGAAVTGYVLGFADFSVLSFAPVPAPGGTFWLLRYFDAMPTTPKKGDVAKIDGVLKFYNGSAWEPFAAPVTLDDAVTRTSANGVKSSGIWSAIWGALSALPTGFTSLYDWCISHLVRYDVAQTLSDAQATQARDNIKATLAARGPNHDGFSAWTVSGVFDGWHVSYGPAYDSIEEHKWMIYLETDDLADNVTLYDSSPESATSLDFGSGITATRTALPGYQFGSQSDKPLASEAEAEALRTGKADKSEMAVTPGTGANADKTTIQLKSGTSATALTAHQQLADVYGEPEDATWTFTYPSGYEGGTGFVEWVSHPSEVGHWEFTLSGTGDVAIASSVTMYDPNASVLTGTCNGQTFTATRTNAPVSYQLGTQSDRKLATAAQGAKADAALPAADVVSPSTSSSDSGKAADAKATGDALVARPTKSQLDEGWWSDWTIKRDGMDVTTQVSAPPEFVDGVDPNWDVANSHIPTDYAQVTYITGTENDTSLSWTADNSEYNTVYYTATRHRVAAPVPTKPEDIGAANAADLNAKLDATSAAPAFSSDSATQYAVGSHCTYNGKLYKCTTATTGGTWVAGSWTADTMTDPDAVLDITAQNQLRVVAKDGTVLWAQGHDLASTSSATLACDATNNFTFADGATSQAFTLPTAPTGKVGDFGLDIDNSANTSAATLTLTGLDTAFSVVVPEGESLNDMLAIAAGELARFYISLSTFRINNLPTWHIVKQVVKNGGAQS